MHNIKYNDSFEHSLSPVMKTLYPSIEPNQSFHLMVSDVHEIYVETCGNPDGVPVVFVHGGPGAGCGEDDRCFFDPEKYHIVLFDQRGSRDAQSGKMLGFYFHAILHACSVRAPPVYPAGSVRTGVVPW